MSCGWVAAIQNQEVVPCKSLIFLASHLAADESDGFPARILPIGYSTVSQELGDRPYQIHLATPVALTYSLQFLKENHTAASV